MAVCPCELSLTAKNYQMAYDGPAKPRIIVIGEQPSAQDDRTGRLFSGESGRKLKHTLQQAGVNLKEVGFTNIVSCHCEKRPKAEYIRCCNQTLMKTLKSHNKNLELVILVGSVATKTILQKTKMDELAGKIHRIGGVYHLPLHEPEKKQSEGKKKQEIRDIQKALALLNLDVDSCYSWEMIDSKRLAELQPELLKAKPLTFDCETSSLDMNDATQFIIGIGFCYDTQNRKGCFVSLEHPDLHITKSEYESRVKLLREVFLSGVPLRAFNGGFDASWLHRYLDVDIDKLNYISDPMHEYHLIREQGESYKLENLTLKYLPDMGGYDAEVDVLKVKYGIKFAYFPLDKIASYCVGDCVATARLSEEVFDSQVKRIDSWNVYHKFIVPAILPYDKISMNGIKLDIPYCKQMTMKYAQKVERLKAKCEETKLVRDNFSSLDVSKSAQVKHLLYDKLKLPKQYSKDSGSLSADKKAIEALLNTVGLTEHIEEFLLFYKDYSVVNTVDSRYASKWKNWIGWDGLVHPHYNLSGTITGRLATSNPNFAQLSRNQSENPEMTEGEQFMLEWPVRRMLISRFPDGRLVSSDYGQLELRVMVMRSVDSIMMSTYKENLHGGDLHTARAVKDHPDYYEQLKSVQKAWRTTAKTANFAGAYSMSEEFLATYLGLGEYVEKIKAQIQGSGEIRTITGRVRKLPNARLPYPRDKEPWKMSREDRSNYFKVQSALRQGVNTSIQEPAHTIMVGALVNVNRRMVAEGIKSLLILEIHDDLLSDCVPEEIEIVGKILQEEMEGMTNEIDWSNGVPLVAEPEVGVSWDKKQPLIFST